MEALHDVQRAIELNDNRAVYRSRLLLDADEASRSAGLGRIYSDLGFQQLALVEGWKSVNTDPTNFSSHRLLADSYAILPRHEIARVSELLQSQLLQPLNQTPIQPRLAESNLFLLSAGGPTALSFNEFNPLFNRNGVALQLSGLGGENGTYAGEAVLAGIYGKAAVSLGYSDSRTNGFRVNADQKDRIGNAFVQFDLTPDTSLQAEYRYRQDERGDIGQRFFRDEFSRTERNTEERHTIRVGARHNFSPASIVLLSLTWQNADTRLTDKDVIPEILPGSFATVKRPQKSFSAELQHLFRSQYVTLTTGFGFFDIEDRANRVFGLNVPGLGFLVTDNTARLNLTHYNMYSYANIHPFKTLTFTLGLSGDVTDGDSDEVAGKREINPKFGVTWNPLPDTTVRLAGFRMLKRTLITNQTLEPTQVAGFNQFFDDFNGTTGWRYGGAIDQKITRDLFVGVEYSARTLDVPFLGAANDVERESTDEQFGHTYLFWTPHPWVALRAEYQIERFKSPAKHSQPARVDTQRVPFGFSFFHPSGFSAYVRETYINQDVKLEESAEPRSGHTDFWLTDAQISYRLPYRYGIVSVGATNLFDRNFKFFERDENNPSIEPARFVYLRLTLALP